MVKKSKKSITLRGFTEDVSTFSLLAIRAAESDTRMAWLLNRALRLDFVHCHDLCGRQPDNQPQPTMFGGGKPEECRKFAVFCAASDILHRSYILVTNRQSSQALIKKLAQVDYLLKISGALPDNELSALGATIRAIPGVQACFAVFGELKSDPLLVTLTP